MLVEFTFFLKGVSIHIVVKHDPTISLLRTLNQCGLKLAVNV